VVLGTWWRKLKELGGPKGDVDLQLQSGENLVEDTRVHLWRMQYSGGWAKLGLTNRRLLIRYYPNFKPLPLADHQQQELDVPLSDITAVDETYLLGSLGGKRIVLKLRDGAERGFWVIGKPGQRQGAHEHWLALLRGHIGPSTAP
jgi:hypothetical protein